MERYSEAIEELSLIFLPYDKDDGDDDGDDDDRSESLLRKIFVVCSV